MAKYALVNDDTGLVVNIIVWDGKTKYAPPEGMSLIEDAENMCLGATWDGSVFTPPVSEETTEE